MISNTSFDTFDTPEVLASAPHSKPTLCIFSYFKWDSYFCSMLRRTNMNVKHGPFKQRDSPYESTQFHFNFSFFFVIKTYHMYTFKIWFDFIFITDSDIKCTVKYGFLETGYNISTAIQKCGRKGNNWYVYLALSTCSSYNTYKCRRKKKRHTKGAKSDL